MKTVIVPLDGSDLSRYAISLAETIARGQHGRLMLVHVIDEPAFSDLPPAMSVEDRENASGYLNAVAEAVADDIDTEARVLSGDPTEEILRLAERTPDSMIVMSTHGRGGFGRMVFGSVADKIVRSSTVPVVLMRDECELPHNVLRTILVPLDGSALSETALPYAIELAHGTGATLALVRVIEPYWQSAFIAETPEAVYLSQSQIDEMEEYAYSEARADLDTLATRLRGEGLRVVWEVRTGRPADEIARVAETTDADLIAISTHGRGGIRRWAFGSVTNEVLHRGKTPVLAIPPRAHVRGTKQAQPSALVS